MVAHKTLNTSFLKYIPFGGSGGPERTGCLSCGTVFVLDHTPVGALSDHDTGTWLEAGSIVTSCLFSCYLCFWTSFDCARSSEVLWCLGGVSVLL